MLIEEEIFLRKTVIPSALPRFGFKKSGGVWRYSETFMNGDFRADVTVDKNGKVTGKVFDVAAGEEYLPVRIEDHTGEFVGEVRLLYGEILQKIADACTKSEHFTDEQSNRLTSLIDKKYGEAPDFPFSDYESAGVFRYPANRKWYGIIMNVQKSKVTKQPADGAKDPGVDVLNIKVGAENMENALKIPGVYTAYHMQRKSWISIIMDGTVPDETVMELIDISRNFAISSKKR